MREDPLRRVQRWVSVGLVAMATGVAPGMAFGDQRWAEGRQFGLHEANAERQATAPAEQSLVATAMPGSVLVAQAGGAGAETPADAWQFSLAPYLWASRTKMALDVGRLSQAQTIDFVDILPQLHFVFAAHVEARRREWTGFLDLFYMSVGQSETQNAVSVSANLQLMLFEFGGTYRLGPVSLGRAGRLTFEPLAGGRFVWVDASLGFPNQKVSESASLIDPMVGGRIAYHITDTVALWFRGDVAGFGISDNQTQLTYNLIAGLEWRFWPRASALAGWRYLDIDLETGSGARTLDLDIQMSGPFLGLNVHF